MGRHARHARGYAPPLPVGVREKGLDEVVLDPADAVTNCHRPVGSVGGVADARAGAAGLRGDGRGPLKRMVSPCIAAKAVSSPLASISSTGTCVSTKPSA
jgi:hypothetical protein